MFVRTLAFPLSVLFLGIGPLMIVEQREHRSLHDLIAKTCVVYDWGDRSAAAGAVGMVGILAVVDALYPFWFVALFGYVLWIAALATTFLIRVRHHQAQTPSTAGAGMRPGKTA